MLGARKIFPVDEQVSAEIFDARRVVWKKIH
jgi:hypothetical protein